MDQINSNGNRQLAHGPFATEGGVRVQQRPERQDAVRARLARDGERISSEIRAEDTPQNRRRVEDALRTLEDRMQRHSGDAAHTRYQFRVHSDSGKLQVALVNYMTGETVEEIPSKKLLEFASMLEELSGIVLEKRA